ncbi:MAG: hypothetical protein U9N57_03425 [Pseudomonadota bacterium]|nr:hypothetical protein [Pseudomonadota bacterium]
MFSIPGLLALPRWQKRLISIIVDFLGLLLIAILSIWLRLGNTSFPNEGYLIAIILLPFLAIPVFIRLGLYRAVIRYIGHKFAITVLSSVMFVRCV